MHTQIHTRARTHTHTYTHARTHTYTYPYTYIHTHTHTHTTHAHTQHHTHTHAHTHTTHTHICTHIHTHTHTHVKVFTDSKITIFSLKNAKNRKHLIEEIRRKANDLEKENWHIDFTWIKAHAGNSGNELADKLAKEAIKNSEICYNKIPISEIARQEAEKTIAKWQIQWDARTKGRATKEYFPNVTERLKV